MITGMTPRGHPAKRRSTPRVAGRSHDGNRLRLRRPSKSARIKRAVRKTFLWTGWKAVGAVAASLVAISTAIVAVATFHVSTQTLKANTRDQSSQRFTKAIEQLGSDKLDVRLGGIYGLEQLARESPSEHPAIIDTLAAYVREHAPRQSSKCAGPSGPIEGMDPQWAPSPDVQTAIDAIGRRDRNNDRQFQYVKLSDTCLRGVQLTQANLSGVEIANSDLRDAIFDIANLERATFNESDIESASFINADLASANFSDCKLQNTMFGGANMTGAFLDGADLSHALLGGVFIPGPDGKPEQMLRAANLSGADLIGATLTNASLSGVNLSGADLEGASLSGANLSGANLQGIYYTKSTAWPTGFQPPPSRPSA